MKTDGGYVSSVFGRLAAVALLGVMLLGVGWNIMAPLRTALFERDAARGRYARYEAVLAASSDTSGVRYDVAQIAAAHTDDASAQLTLQALLDRTARAAGFSVTALRPTGGEALGAVGRAVWVEATLSGDLQSLTQLLAALDRERPILLVRMLEIEAGNSARPDTNLRVRLEAGRVWRDEGATP